MDCCWPCNVCTSSDVLPKNKYIDCCKEFLGLWLKIEIREMVQIIP